MNQYPLELFPQDDDDDDEDDDDDDDDDGEERRQESSSSQKSSSGHRKKRSKRKPPLVVEIPMKTMGPRSSERSSLLVVSRIHVWFLYVSKQLKVGRFWSMI